MLRLVRGVNNLGIESGTCCWGTPLNTWDQEDTESTASIQSNEIPVNQHYDLTKLANQKLGNIFWEFTKDFLTYASINYQHVQHGCVVPNATYENGPLIISDEPR